MSQTAKTIRILSTSDLHGRMVPWDYAQNKEDKSGSAAQLLTAIHKYRNDNTILADAGDLIQGNSAELFLEESVHPMVMAANRMGYDIWVTGNHEYNFGIETVKKTIADLDAVTLTGNVFLSDGTPLARGYTILERDGIRAAFIGMTSHNIVRWDKQNLTGCTVTDALDETRKIIDSIQGQYDVLIGVFHESIQNECNTPNTGVTDICNACPEFDAMISSHGHMRIPECYINDVLVVQNASDGKTMSCIDLKFEADEKGWKCIERAPEMIDIQEFAPDPELLNLFEPYHQRARTDAEVLIGHLEGGPLTPEEEIRGVPPAVLKPTPLIDLIHRVQLYYSNADVSATALFTLNAGLPEGRIRKCDVSMICRFPNELYRVSMTGAQLKQFMEFSAGFYNTFKQGDLTISFNPKHKYYLYMMFAGVNYEIDISAEPGSRIRKLTYPDGRPVRDDDVLRVAANDYCANSYLLAYGDIFHEGEPLPVLEESGIHNEIGGIRELIRDYIVNVEHGVLNPKKTDNWRLTGIFWPEALRKRVIQAVNDGILELPETENHQITARPIREEDLPPESDKENR